VAKLITSGRVGPSLLALFLLPALAYAGYSVADRWYQGYLLVLEEQALRSEVADLRLENLRLQAALKYARGDEHVETIAREQLGLIRPGDRALLLVGPTPPAAPEGATNRRESAPVPDKPAWRKLLDALFGR
jgi:cell division protein FtsB